MIKTEVFTGEEIEKKWPELKEWISNCHLLKFEIEFIVVETQCETGEVMDYHDSGIRRVTIEFREFSEAEQKIRDDSRPFETS